MTTVAEIKRQIDGLPAPAAAAIVRDAREAFNRRRLALVDKATDLTRQLAEVESNGKPSAKAAEMIRKLREETCAERETAQVMADALNTLLLSIEGQPQQASTIKPDWSIGKAN